VQNWKTASTGTCGCCRFLNWKKSQRQCFPFERFHTRWFYQVVVLNVRLKPFPKIRSGCIAPKRKWRMNSGNTVLNQDV